MNLHIQPAPVRKSIHVNAPPERAFDVFANGIGRWYERDVDGSECEIGRVLVWDPPSRLVLAWQLTADWAYDADLVTEVEVLFTRDANGTRVDLEHRHLERMGESADAARESVDSPNGWGLILQLFSDEAAR
jgi:uncharacterized protein YndB with AHSA1/START domain